MTARISHTPGKDRQGYRRRKCGQDDGLVRLERFRRSPEVEDALTRKPRAPCRPCRVLVPSKRKPPRHPETVRSRSVDLRRVSESFYRLLRACLLREL